jgi:porphobilinogen synthase
MLKAKAKTYVPITRGRRLRTNESIRFSSRDDFKSVWFYVSMFIAEGENVQVEIGSMPGNPSFVDLTVKEVKEIIRFRYSRGYLCKSAKI